MFFRKRNRSDEWSYFPFMVNSQPPEALLALAPLHLPNRRKDRYLGDNLCVTLEEMAEADQGLARKLYRVLSELLNIITDTATNTTRKWHEVLHWTQYHRLDTFIDELGRFGESSHAQGASERLAKAMHDVRGGALSALLGRLQMLGYLALDEKQLQTIFVLARDHLKIMRSAVIGLDAPRRRADQQPKSHDVFLILEKWHESVSGPRLHAGSTRMFVDCRYSGALTECCLESAAIDRIFYNLATNACRHSAGERLDMIIFPIPEPPGDSLRFVLSNQVSERDKEHLNTLTKGAITEYGHHGARNLNALFEPAVSSTGSGFGLTVAADFVAGAYGLRDRAEALRQRYVGAVLDGNTFRAWFHWPIASDTLPPKLDDYRRPNESLSEP